MCASQLSGGLLLKNNWNFRNTKKSAAKPVVLARL